MAILMRNGHPILSDVSKWDQLEEKPFDDLNKDFSVEPADPTNPSSRQVLHWGKEATWNEYNNPSYDKEGVHIVEMATPGVDTDYSAMEVSYDAEPDLTSATDPTLDNTTPAKMTGRDSLNTFFSKVSTAMGNLRWLFAHIGDLKQLTSNGVGDGTLVGGIMKNYDRIQRVTASQYATMQKAADTYYYVDEEEQNVLASNVINDNTTNNRGATVQAAINSLNNDLGSPSWANGITGNDAFSKISNLATIKRVSSLDDIKNLKYSCDITFNADVTFPTYSGSTFVIPKYVTGRYVQSGSDAVIFGVSGDAMNGAFYIIYRSNQTWQGQRKIP